MRHLVNLSFVLLLATPSVAADLVIFVNGDRLSGEIIGRGTKAIRLKTPYGRLEIPRREIERLVSDDGGEETVTAAAQPSSPSTTTVDLDLLVTGSTYWRAWDPSEAPEDPSLRLLVLLEGQKLVTYTDVTLDPEDLPGAVVNSFVFDSERLLVDPEPGVEARPPELGRGAVQLSLELPRRLEGRRRLVLAYQVNEGTTSRPEWRVVVRTEARVTLSPGEAALVKLEQDRGRMEFRDQVMQSAETFRVLTRVIPPRLDTP